ncbi:hypothetical protein B0J15DRAFT_536315 [Fusarium solani]|uniref:Uncharacterized protein n=1 Tax=Fusarium solani TaxID=169388 RepID=A0A9P9HAN6_FUSSL|nr:uncharacterized protein B0J15DRAFT_536315 [Fusarium solani]KAH7253373.1 hypothetical protein B0J15DRAFT_536315 [Fusarium solani]
MEIPSRSTPHALEYQALSISSSDEAQSETPPRKRANEDSHGHSAVMRRSNLGPATILADFASILCPLALLGFSIVILQTEGRAIDETYFSYQNAITTLSRWMLERGATMVTLEQLMGSRTLGAAFLTQAELGAFNLVGLVIVFTWIWSPLGGQALLRMLDSRLDTIISPSTVVHFDTDAAPQFEAWYEVSVVRTRHRRSIVATPHSMYNAALLSPDSIRNDSQDLWGNRVPSSPTFEYSALVGIPINNISVGNSSFPIETTYVHLDCFSLKKTLSPNGKFIDIKNTSLEGLSPSLPNGTWQGYKSNDASWTLAVDTFADIMWENYSFYERRGLNRSQINRPSMFTNEVGVEANPTTLLMQVEYPRSGMRPSDWFSAKCGVVQHYVESRINCSLASRNALRNCTVVEQRPSQKAHAPKDISFLSFPIIFRQLSLQMPGVAQHDSEVYGLEPSLKYLQNPSTASMGSDPLPALENVTQELFSYRLGQLINSYLLIGQFFDSILSGNIAVEVTNLSELYHVSRAWTGTFMFSVVFVHLATSPDVLGFVSTVVQAAKMDGLDWTKLMKMRRIRYGVVHRALEAEPLFGVGSEEAVEKLKRL